MPIVDNVLGRVAETKAEQQTNANSPISPTPSGIVMEESFSQLAKALGRMIVR